MKTTSTSATTSTPGTDPTTARRVRRRRLARTGMTACGFALAVAMASPAAAAPSSPDLATACRRSGGTFSGEASIRPTCHRARLSNPFFEQAAAMCGSARGEFIVEPEDRYKVGGWTCDMSAL